MWGRFCGRSQGLGLLRSFKYHLNLPRTFLPVRPHLSTVLSKFTHTFFFLRVSPPGGCHPGRSAPLRSSDATVCIFLSFSQFSQIKKLFVIALVYANAWPWYFYRQLASAPFETRQRGRIHRISSYSTAEARGTCPLNAMTLDAL